jgi:hypothetical protein
MEVIIMEVKEFDVVRLKNGMVGTIVDTCNKDVCLFEMDSEFIVDNIWFMHIYTTDIEYVIYRAK